MEQHAFIILPKELNIIHFTFEDRIFIDVCQFEEKLEAGTIYSLSTDCEEFMEYMSISDFLEILHDASDVFLANDCMRTILEEAVESFTFEEALQALLTSDKVKKISPADFALML